MQIFVFFFHRINLKRNWSFACSKLSLNWGQRTGEYYKGYCYNRTNFCIKYYFKCVRPNFCSDIGQLPVIKPLSRTIQRTRVIKENAPVNPSNTKDLIVPERYKLTNKNETFMAYDSGSSESRILIFSTQYNLNMLQETNDWSGDGTFKSASSIFSQLYKIHCYTRSLIIL